jgi:flavin reductase (DIM6/NTAB) family NADH-FMN oxidoreductase RutF
MKIDVQTTDYLKELIGVMTREGLLLCVAGPNGRPNAMTIGWGTVGVIWGRPIFVALVRPTRYTYGLLEAAGDFTVNLMPRNMADAVAYCGSVSGRDHDKLAERGLTPVPAKMVRSPLIDEAVLQLECRVVHRNKVEPASLPPEIDAMYNQDYHGLFYGHILAVHADPDLRSKTSMDSDR